MRHFFLIIIIAASIGVFMTMVIPRYKKVQAMKEEVSSFDGRLATAEKLKQSREELIARYNSISKTDLDNLKVLLPDTVDNIRLIIQIDSLATKNGMSSLRGVEYEAIKPDQQTKPESPQSVQKPYGEFTLSFTTTGQYKNFLSFIADLEQNLRLVDITAVEFKLTEDKALGDSLSYKVTLKTYWLKK